MILIRLKYTGAIPGVISKANMNRKIKAAWLVAGTWWHKEMRPKHFTKRGAREYGYVPRYGEPGSGRRFRGSYTGRKLRRFGHTNPLVFTGLSRDLTRVRDVRNTAKGVRVVMNAPTLNRRPRGGRINMRDEMTRISIAERNQLIRLMDRKIHADLRADRTTRVKRYG